MSKKEFREGDIVKEVSHDRIGEIIRDIDRTSIFEWLVEWENGETSEKNSFALQLIERHCKYHGMKLLYSTEKEELFCPTCQYRKGDWEKTEIKDFINDISSK